MAFQGFSCKRRIGLKYFHPFSLTVRNQCGGTDFHFAIDLNDPKLILKSISEKILIEYDYTPLSLGTSFLETKKCFLASAT